MPIIYLYAEVLANIRQANLYASLETDKNEHTTIDIASDKKTITVSHDGETASIYLPTEIGGTAEVNIPVDRAKDLSVRLELADIMNMPSVKDTVGNEGPWSANDLSPNTQLQCRICTAELLTNETPLGFRDLPSEHWAEMMDFWHCHRPHDGEPSQETDAAEAAGSKGYGSASKLKAAPGVAFIDTVSFLFSEQDCRNIQVGSTLFRQHCVSSSAKTASRDLRAQLFPLGKKKVTSSIPETVPCSGRRYNCPKLNAWLTATDGAPSVSADGYSTFRASTSLELSLRFFPSAGFRRINGGIFRLTNTRNPIRTSTAPAVKL